MFSLANNHSADFGLAGIRATEQSSYQLQQQFPNLTFSGLRPEGQAPGSFAIESIRHKGWHIGFTAISILTNSPRGIEKLQYIHASDDPGLQKFYRWLARQRPNYDLVIVSIHGGTEYKPEPNKQKRQIMGQIAYHGADIVWGHHPHVQQAWEIYRGFDPKAGQGNWALIMYSQGNFVSAQTIRTRPTEPQSFWAATGDSVLLQVEIGQSASGDLELRGLNPLLLTTIRLKPFAFAVAPMVDAATEIRQQGYNGWDDFYTWRQSWLKQRVAAWPKRSFP